MIFLTLGTAAHAEIRILGLGDSLMAGYGLPPGDGFPDQLQTALRATGIDAEVVNAGVSGDTSAGGRARLDWALASNPHAVILELGANDGLRGLEPAETRRNLDAILTALDEKGLPVLLAGMLAPPNLGQEYGAEFEAVFRELAEKHETLFYPFFLDGVVGDPALNQKDGIHPTREGVAIIVKRIMPRVKELISKSKTAAR
ncbi:arylesterase [Nisaea nitritireducens]|uniref:arylesterase n=1 Tax=Nisaea nitritireducens TaxID=568392 RepID=UPI001D029EAF|nr:arylesterase [Nisaea nitritireducens]